MRRGDLFAAMFPISRSTDIDIGRQDGDAAVEGWGGSVLIPVRGDVHNSRMAMAERLDVVGGGGGLGGGGRRGGDFTFETYRGYNCYDISLNSP